jgi:hypothetical protein
VKNGVVVVGRPPTPSSCPPGALAQLLNGIQATQLRGADLYTFTLSGGAAHRYSASDEAVTLGERSFHLGPLLSRGTTRIGPGIAVVELEVTYQASVVMGLCEGPLLEVSRIWRGKNVYSGGYAPTQLLQAVEVITVPESGTYALAHTPAGGGGLQEHLLGRVTTHLPDADPAYSAPSRTAFRRDGRQHSVLIAGTGRVS